jgi:hypothetical protein
LKYGTHALPVLPAKLELIVYQVRADRAVLLLAGHQEAAEARRRPAVVVRVLPEHPADPDGPVA